MNKIAIHSVPRSGSSWLGEIVNSSPCVNYLYQPLFSYAFKAALSEHSTAADIDAFFDSISKTDDEFVLQSVDREHCRKPRFKKRRITHIAYKEVRYHHILENMLRAHPTVKVVGLVRNPLSVLASWYEAPREFRKDLGWTIEEEWRSAHRKNERKQEEYFGFKKWKEATLLFERLAETYGNRFFLITYARLLSDTEAAVSDLFAFLELEFGRQTQQFLVDSSAGEVDGAYSVFRDQASDDKWRGILPQRIINNVNAECRSEGLEQYL